MQDPSADQAEGDQLACNENSGEVMMQRTNIVLVL
jgi:hypothetical protein